MCDRLLPLSERTTNEDRPDCGVREIVGWALDRTFLGYLAPRRRLVFVVNFLIADIAAVDRGEASSDHSSGRTLHLETALSRLSPQSIDLDSSRFAEEN